MIRKIKCFFVGHIYRPPQTSTWYDHCLHCGKDKAGFQGPLHIRLQQRLPMEIYRIKCFFVGHIYRPAQTSTWYDYCVRCTKDKAS